LSSSYYIYVLKDPRTSPAKIFYIGKRTSSESWDQVTEIDATRKGQYVKKIIDSGENVIMNEMFNDLPDDQACHLFSELLSSFGTIETGGQLLNE